MSVEVTLEVNKDLFKQAKDEAVRRGLEKIGQAAETYAKALCPVGTPESTGIPGYMGGTLRGSISHDNDEDTVYLGTNIEYAPYVEMGTVKMEARPYLRPAITDNLEEYKAVFEAELRG